MHPHQSPQLAHYLEHQNDTLISQRLAAQSNWPASHHQGSGFYGSREDLGTSLLVSSSDCTRRSGTPSQELPALSRGVSVTDRSVSTSMGTRQTNHQRILEISPGGALVLPHITEPRVLECPFPQLFCFLTFSNVEDWISHSLTHFRNIDPPTSNKCCFCSAVFPESTGARSWRQRMMHVAFHHKLGHRLATARPDFELYTYLWNHRLIGDADYRDLKGNYEDRSRRVQAHPSLPDTPLNQQSIAFTETERRGRGGRRPR